MANINDINGSSKIKDTYTTIYNNDNAINTELESHLASLVAHLASEISNDSGVTGAKVSDALDTIKTVVDNINAGDSNADIGLYTINDNTNTDDYVGDLGTTTLFGDMHLVLYAENENTGVATLDITDGNGAKTIKKQNKDGTKSDLRAGDLYGFNLLKYDGTDWVIVREKTTENTINSSFYANPEKYIGNVKTIDTFQDDSVWTKGVSGLQSLNQTNVKIGDYSLKLEEDDNTSSVIVSDKEGLSLDLTELNNGGNSDNTDYINLVVYISDVSFVSSLRINFSIATPYSGDDIYYKSYLDSSLSTGWNYLKIAKSDLSTLGSPDLSTIQSIRISWTSLANASGEYVSFQLLQLVKKDPIADYPNPFQEDFTINSGEWYVGEEYNKNIIKKIDTTLGDLNALQNGIKYKNFIINQKSIATNDTSTNIDSPVWHIDDNNLITLFINNDSATLRIKESGVDDDITKSLAINQGDIINIELEKSETEVKANVINLNTGDTLEFYNTTTLISSGNLSIYTITTYLSYIEDISITEISHAHHADIAETAKSLVEMPKARIYNSANQSISNASTTSLTFDSTRYDSRTHFDSNNATRLTIKENGLYNIKANIEFASNATGERHLSIRLNGSTIIGRVRVNANSTSQTNLSLSTSYELTKGDYLEVRVYQDSTVSLDVTNAGNYSPEFMIEKVGE